MALAALFDDLAALEAEFDTPFIEELAPLFAPCTVDAALLTDLIASESDLNFVAASPAFVFTSMLMFSTVN